MICHDFQPLSIVEDEGFQKLMKVTALNYKIPSRKSFTNLLNKKYDVISNTYKTKIKNAYLYCLTTDIWTEPMNSKSFLGITVQIVENYKLSSANLGVYELNERHSGEYIAEKLADVCSKWEIDNDKITAVITNGASNMGLAIELFLGRQRNIHCFAHQLNLVAERAIQKDEELSTKEISGESYVTTSIVIPLVYNLEQKIQEIKIEASAQIGIKLKANLLSEISRRLGAAEQVQLLSIATIFDPRFKKIYFKDKLNCGKAVDYINNLIKEDTSSKTKENRTPK
ncbi:hypothetical protein NQ314_021140 [Rhamnusium bicolor]|uniref:Uncharacterized protein n=1 Tax=Rhamnusium bicolor TaxID=1586634 RepID=A0AAV8WJV2_9CUCU|nr:hypothetical protein NQ314_021140 [Rhamnusium bicolor]